MNYNDYKKEFLNSIQNDAKILGSEVAAEFMIRTLEILEVFNEIVDPIVVSLNDKKCSAQRLMRIDGYSFDETDHSLILLINDFQNSEITMNLTMSRVDELYWKLYYFLEEACSGKISAYLDDSDEALKVARLIKNRMNAFGDDNQLILKIKFYIITNKELDTNLLDKNLLETTVRKSKKSKKTPKPTKKIKKADFAGKPLEISLWHLERLYEMETSNNNDPIIIDLNNDFQSRGIPCVKGNIGENLGYEAYIAIIPGKLLADIYIEYGSRILEGNVRAFLGTNASKGVNNGMKKTINTDPTMFFTYNNGIAVTATDIGLDEANGELLITHLVDMQIINGGQTTATLAEAVLKKNNTDLEGIYVPMKLTVIDDRESENEEGVRFYDQMIQSIAKYANSQNKITAADLFSNDPFHIWMEKMSKKHLGPPAKFPIHTGWYYERSRKKYQQEQIKLNSDDIKRFMSKFPKNQIINKEQLAMYLTTIACKPHIVAKGKNWVMKEFGNAIGSDYKTKKGAFNEFFFKKCICSAIIYRTTDDYLESNKRTPSFWYNTGGYKLNIIPYAISKIISCIPSGYTLDWNFIWSKQSLSLSFLKEIETVTKLANEFFNRSHGLLVTEYCKREDTWKSFRDEVHYEFSDSFLRELQPESLLKEDEESAINDQRDIDDLIFVTKIIELGAHYWTRLYEEGISHNLLTHVEQTYLKKGIEFAEKGNIPCSNSGKIPSRVMTMAKEIISINDKLESEGLCFTADGVVKLFITDYKMA